MIHHRSYLLILGVLALAILFFIKKDNKLNDIYKELTIYEQDFAELIKDCNLKPMGDVAILSNDTNTKELPDLLHGIALVNSIDSQGVHTSLIGSDKLEKNYSKLWDLGYKKVFVYPSCLIISDENYSFMGKMTWLLYCNGNVELTEKGRYKGGIIVNKKYPNNWFSITFMN